LQSSQILYTFVLSAEIATTFAPKMDKICMPAFQRTSIICSFARLQKKTCVEKYFYGFGGKQKAALKRDKCSINNNPCTTKLVSNIKVSRCKNDNVFICDFSFVDANDAG
jgi:hypothetical protein